MSVRSVAAQIRGDLAPYLPQAAAFTLITATAVVWHWVLGWDLIRLAVVILILLVALQEARILSVNNRLEDHLADADEALGPVAPEYEGEGRWLPAEPVVLAPIVPFGAGVPPQPSPFPREPKTEPIVLPAPEGPATVPASAVVDEEWAKIMADTDAYIAELRAAQ